MSKGTSRAGFSLVEIIIVLSVLSILAGVITPRLQTHLRKSRDQRRLADMKAIQRAIEQYYADKGDYPPAEGGVDPSWDDSHIGGFIPRLMLDGYVNEYMRDPVNDAAHHYEYYRYDVGATCPATTSNTSGHYYILRLKAFEGSEFAATHVSALSCGSTNWKSGYAYVLGGGAVLQ